MFDEGTYGSGPICNACCVELEFAPGEDAADEPALKEQRREAEVRASDPAA